MRFACQSCGKAYNLPEDKIADKSNVKLKCRVCGAIVEVKKHGEVVAQLLADVDGKRVRVSEAPAPLTSVSADDADDATHAIAVGDLSDSSADDAAAAALLGHVKSALGQQRGGLGPLPPPPPTGFGSVPLVPNFGAGPGSSPLIATPAPSAFAAPPAATPVPPPLAPPEPPPFSRPEAVAPPLPSPVPALGGSPPPPPLPSLGGADPLPHMPSSGLPSAPIQNGSNGLSPRYGDVVPLPDEPLPPVAMPSSPLAEASGAVSGIALGGVAEVEVVPNPPASDDTTRKMLAAFATGLLIGFIIARLFF